MRRGVPTRESTTRKDTDESNLQRLGVVARRVDRSQAAVMRNLLELYCHDMSEWFSIDADEYGQYNYAPDKVWSDLNDVYIAYHQRIPIGFALLGPGEPFTGDADSRDLDEFFIVRRHRRSGIGRAFAMHVWDRHPGSWVVRVFQGNRPALPFWRGTVAAYTGGTAREDVRTIKGRAWSYFTFAATAATAHP